MASKFANAFQCSRFFFFLVLFVICKMIPQTTTLDRAVRPYTGAPFHSFLGKFFACGMDSPKDLMLSRGQTTDLCCNSLPLGLSQKKKLLTIGKKDFDETQVNGKLEF